MNADAPNIPAPERYDGPTSNGGDYVIAYFSDADRNPTTRVLAHYVESVECLADGTEIFRTYGILKPDAPVRKKKEPRP